MGEVFHKLTPMMEQWHSAKKEHPDAVLLFRMGDFYELFGDDARLAAPILDLTLTSRDKDKSGVKMAGFPHHAAESYVQKLIEHGHKVAICEQLEDPKLSRGVVKRGITNVITPGTAIDAQASHQGSSSPLLGITVLADVIFLSILDLATATFKITSSRHQEKIVEEILRIAPKELLVHRNDAVAYMICEQLRLSKKCCQSLRIEKRDSAIKRQKSPSLLTIVLTDPEQKAANLVLDYLYELKGGIPRHIDCPQRYSIDQQLLIDEATRANLDLFPKRKGDRANLFTILDKTKTVMGRRLLYQALRAPLSSLEEINYRHDLVLELLAEPTLRTALRETLQGCHDVEKLTALVAGQKISPRKMGELKDSLLHIGHILKIFADGKAIRVSALLRDLPDVSHLANKLSAALSEDLPINAKDGGVFKAGYDEKLDELRDLIKSGKKLLLDLEAKERSESKIPSLKIKFTRVFGYYIEITNTHLAKVPKHYRRKQTLASGERYVTDELFELEGKLSTAELDASSIEEKMFHELISFVSESAKLLMEIGKKVALLDLVCGFAELAKERGLVKPVMLPFSHRLIDIEGGRHPIVEDICFKDGTYFVPNNVRLDHQSTRLMLITGPNMAGKSTIMRHAALIQIMAQIGAFVPAKSATLSICDAIFARVGASDDLSTGRSTFMVEMTETATILRNATQYSLILLDEIGRGTSTYDGLSMAQAIAEYLHQEVQARTIFATHYHELTTLSETLRHLKNYHVEIAESDARIQFLYTLKPGACLKSFGIQVARLSGLPTSVLVRAQEVLSKLESKASKTAPLPASNQLALFQAIVPNNLSSEHLAIFETILSIDVNRLTPLQALNRLASWQALLRSSDKLAGSSKAE